MKQRIELVVNDTENVEAVNAVNYLLAIDNSFKITIVYSGAVFTGIIWDTSTQSFKIHNDFISTASGTDFKGGSMIGERLRQQTISRR